MSESIETAYADEGTGEHTGGHCLGCGEPVPGSAATCPVCGADHLPAGRLESLGETAEWDRDWGVGWLRLLPPLIPLVLWRQTRIEGAQRELVTYRSQFDDVEEVHCRACGGPVARDAEDCPACGYGNVAAAIDELAMDVHDAGDRETDRSNRWWVGPVFGPPVGLVGWAAAGSLAVPGLEGAILWSSGLLAAGAGYLDREYVRANGPWSPTYLLLVGLVFPVFDLVLAYYYGHKRVQTLGWGALR